MIISCTDRPDWQIDGRNWPNRQFSSFHKAAGLRWHMQRSQNVTAPGILLLHGTGASTHSFARLFEALADKLNVLAVDLPGHGFTSGASSGASSLPGMAKAIKSLLETIGFKPVFAAGHSAGAAILLEMASEQEIATRRIFGINSAIEPIRGEQFFSPIAKLAFLNPFSAGFLSMTARHSPVANSLLRATGSSLSSKQEGYYKLLFAHSGHVNGALAMMANWNLHNLKAKLSKIETPVTLIATEDDPMVPASGSIDAAQRLPDAELVLLPKGGHLVHETDPDEIAEIVLARMA
jgi:magnesium chelatase accessory protein